MKSNKKCKYCGEFEEELTYAGIKPEGQDVIVHDPVTECKNYENCPKYKYKKEE